MRGDRRIFLGKLGESRPSDLALINGPDYLWNSNGHLGRQVPSILTVRLNLINGWKTLSRGLWFSPENTTRPPSSRPRVSLSTVGIRCQADQDSRRGILLMSLITTPGPEDRAAHLKPRHTPPRSGIARGLARRSGVCPMTHYQFGNVSRGQCLDVVKSPTWARIQRIAENIRRDILFHSHCPSIIPDSKEKQYPSSSARRPTTQSLRSRRGDSSRLR
ncbi:hypothetical protein F511_36803 [Dorcoceras hygrometricum]|uniref:Uncharacterized protein n=1 Tax=Dorcoceras hygrometricum TaxID=472368 RepID=A0A2Z7BEA8_9LAMI|nr:hypothetical protein F511_36803 [Dorcoceras hygrometricum]